MIAPVDSGKSVTSIYSRLGTIPALNRQTDRQTALMKQYRVVQAMHADAKRKANTRSGRLYIGRTELESVATVNL